MAYTPTPVDRAGDAIRQVTSIVIAAQLIDSGSSLSSEQDTRNLVAELLAAAEFLGKIGQDAIEEVEAAISLINSPTMMG